MSKFSPAEFVPSAKYFQGNRSPIEAEKEAVGYSNAWLHHKSHNKHHWEYWCDYDNDTGAVFPHKIPYAYVVEMVCDWIGAGKVYGGSDWNQEEPLKYYNKVRAGRHFHDDTEKLIVSMLETISNRGLDAFHKRAKSGLWNDWYETGCKRTGHVEPHIVLETPLTVEYVSQNED